MDLNCDDFFRAGYLRGQDCCVDCHLCKQYSHLVMPPKHKALTKAFMQYTVFEQKHILMADVCCRAANIIKKLTRKDWAKMVIWAGKNGKSRRTQF